MMKILKMKKTIIFSLILFTIPIFCQPGKDIVGGRERPLTFSTYFNPETLLSNTLMDTPSSTLDFKTDFLNDSTSIMMGTRLQLAGFYNKPFENSRNSLLNPLYQSYLDSQKNKWIKQVLGAIQVGAVGILAYQHIKKYGLFKKKDD
jgi:hypothetical protein